MVRWAPLAPEAPGAPAPRGDLVSCILPAILLGGDSPPAPGGNVEYVLCLGGKNVKNGGDEEEADGAA
jgi:hypothetical protein